MNMMKKIAALLGASLHTPQGYRAPRRKTGAALRNPTDPHQKARIEAAAAKRARKAVKYSNHCQRHSRLNHTHRAAINDLTFNPFYIAK